MPELLVPYRSGKDTVFGSAPVAVTLAFVATPPKTTKLSFPNPDIDNFEKALFDIATGSLWDDDKQVVCTQTLKMWAQDGLEPGIHFRVEEICTKPKSLMQRFLSLFGN